MYRCETTSIEGFVQKVAVDYVRRGYFFFSAGRIPAGKDAGAIDAKLLAKYRIDGSKKERARRKQNRQANMQYIRHENFFVLLATHGSHDFFESEDFQDARRTPIRYAGYSISFRNGRVCVRIEVEEYKRLKAYMAGLACRRSAASLAEEFRRIPFLPYAPVRQQLLQIWRAVNRARLIAGYARLPVDVVPWKRAVVKPFEKPARAERAKAA